MNFFSSDFWLAVFNRHGVLGVFNLFLCVVIWYLIKRYLSLADKRCQDIIKAKDAEIERLVKERNYLQEQFINRLSSAKTMQN